MTRVYSGMVSAAAIPAPRRAAGDLRAIHRDFICRVSGHHIILMIIIRIRIVNRDRHRRCAGRHRRRVQSQRPLTYKCGIGLYEESVRPDLCPRLGTGAAGDHRCGDLGATGAKFGGLRNAAAAASRWSRITRCSRIQDNGTHPTKNQEDCERQQGGQHLIGHGSSPRGAPSGHGLARPSGRGPLPSERKSRGQTGHRDRFSWSGGRRKP